MASRRKRTEMLLNILIYTRQLKTQNYLLKTSIVPILKNTELRKVSPGQQRF